MGEAPNRHTRGRTFQDDDSAGAFILRLRDDLITHVYPRLGFARNHPSLDPRMLADQVIGASSPVAVPPSCPCSTREGNEAA